MFKKIIYISFMFASMLSAATVNTNKDNYSSMDPIVVSYAEMEGQSSEWIAVYPKGSTNDFGNIVQWKLTNGDVEGSITMDALGIGIYDVRVFNGANFLVSKLISIKDNVTSVETTQDSYLSDDEIVAVFDNMSGNEDDWIGIYPAGSSNAWANMLQWEWIEDGLIAGTQIFDPLPAGDYEVRLFFNNSFNDEAVYAFSVEDNNPVAGVKTTKDSYLANDEIITVFDNMSGNEDDWIGIYPTGSTNAWANMLQWSWVENGLLDGTHTFNAMPVGDYEVRVFFNNSFDTEASYAFTVEDNPAPVRVLYDDFEDGIDPRWTKYFGKDMVLLNVGVPDGGVEHTERKEEVNGQHSLRTFNSDGLAQSSGYFFDFESPDKKFKFLEVDMRIGDSSHRFAFGVKIKTKLGDRRIEFASWLNHTLPSGQQIVRGPYKNVLAGHREAFTQDNYLHVHPAPSDYFVGTSSYSDDAKVGIVGAKMFVHYKINIEETLRVLEPDNELLEITLFTTSGGEYDNLALSTH